MNRTIRNALLATVGALVVAAVAAVAAPDWFARNRVFAVLAIAVAFWAFARELFFGVVAEDRYGALATWLSHDRDAYPLAQVCIVGRQGCGRADGRKLRAELEKARAALIDRGVYVARSDWEAVFDAIQRQTYQVSNDDELFRAAVLGQLGLGRDFVAAKLAEPQPEDRRVLFRWLADGSVDDDAVKRLGDALELDEAWALDFGTGAPWFLFTAPNERARALLECARTRLERDLAAMKQDSDGDFAETVHRLQAAVTLLDAIVHSWGGDRAGLAKAFREHRAATVDFYGLAQPVWATWLEARLLGAMPPAEALARLREHLPPLAAAPSAHAAAAPTLAALDAISSKLLIGNGLTVRSAPGGLQLIALPSQPNADFI